MDSAKEKKAIERLKAFEPADGYYLAYSGGKDSDCIKILAQLSGVKFEAVHNLTTVDAPETVRYVQSQPDVKIDKAYDKNGNHVTMWNLIVKKLMPPTRLARYCYSELKERGGIGRVVVTGVRWSESQRRKETSDVIKIIGKPKATMKAADEIGIVGQYTGLTDTNGNKIFEGDIVVSDYIDYEDERGVIQWDSDIAKFIITFSTFTIDFDNVYGRELEIVGNVYDNPELLEAGEMP